VRNEHPTAAITGYAEGIEHLFGRLALGDALRVLVLVFGDGLAARETANRHQHRQFFVQVKYLKRSLPLRAPLDRMGMSAHELALVADGNAHEGVSASAFLSMTHACGISPRPSRATARLRIRTFRNDRCR